jgi:hypothetical protein
MCKLNQVSKTRYLVIYGWEMIRDATSKKSVRDQREIGNAKRKC